MMIELIYFFQPGCPICEQDFPILQAALATHKSHVRLTKVNAKQNRATAEKYNVIGTPSIVIKSKGREKKYDGIPTNVNELITNEVTGSVEPDQEDESSNTPIYIIGLLLLMAALK